MRDRKLYCRVLPIVPMYPDLPGHCYFIVQFIANRTLILVCIVKCNGHSCLGNAGLSSLIHQLLETASSNLLPGERGGEGRGEEGQHT